MASYLESAERYAEIERERIRNIINANNNAIGNAPAITQAQTYSVTPTVPSAEKNKGDIIGGIGYLAEKAGAGLVSSVEGIWDFVAGGIADLVGADRWAKRQVENEWFGDWYDTAGDWYNAGSGWKVAGDIAGGIGTSIPALAGALIAGPAGWAGLATTFGIAATSAGGTSLREAYDKTGKLTGKEWAYAGMSGATEGILESVTDVLGMGIGGTVAKLGKVGGKAVAKTAAQNVAKQGIIKTAAKTAGKSFVGEAFEEGMSAILNPQYAKLTYDPNAENATMQEIAYSAFVGGMAGVVMGGGSTAYTEIKSRATASKLINDKTDGEVLTLAEALIKKDDSDPIGTSIMRDVRGAYQELTESLKGTNGEYTIGRQKYLLGRLNLLTTEATLNEATVASAIYAINNADSIAESLNALGYTDANGNKITYTAEQIREGFKTEGIGKRRAVQNALERNPILRMLSVSDAANRLLMDTSAFNEQTLSGRRIQSQKELNDYIEQAPELVKRELGRALGIEDWSTANYIDVNKALASYLGDENNVKAAEKRLALKKEFEAKRDARPLVVGRATAYAAKKDGIRRYKANGNDYAIKKEGDTYTLYDYTDKIASKDLTLAELRRSLSEYDTKHNNAQETTKDTENAAKEKTASEKEAAKPKREKSPVEKSYEIANKSVAKYDKLSANDQSMVRKIIRQGIALGAREDVIVYAANIAARTHTDVVFNKDMCAVPTKDGKHIRGYANGAYIASEKRFYFNPEAQTTDGFIIHELDHAIRKRVGADGGVTTKIFKKAIDAAGKDTYTEITKRYGTKTDVPKGKFILGKTETTEQKISKTEDEVEAFYAETALKDKDILKHMLAEKPTLKDRILNFFKGAVSDYASIPELDADAKKYYKQYRKWFAEFEKDQRGTQINTRFEGDGGDVRYSFSSISQSFFGDPNITAKDFESRDYKKTDGYKAFVDKSIDNMLKTHAGFNDVKARAEIEKSIDGIVRVAIAAKKAGYDILDRDDMRDKKDSKGRLLFSSLEPNSDYFTSHDLSTICDKRLTFTEIYDEIVRREETIGVKKGKRFFDNIDNFFVLHDIMADKGMTTPCRQCYVDSMRKNLAPMARKFIQLVQETNPNNKKNDQLFTPKGEVKVGNSTLREKVLEELKNNGLEPSYFTVQNLTTEKGLVDLRLRYPLLYEAFNSFYGQSKPKMPKEAVPYRFGELTAMLKDHNGKINTERVKRINSTGGFRLQSYSDFQIKNYVDVLQVIFEAGTLGLSGHAYTKVPAFLDATDGTNLKRNISIFTYKDGAEWKIDRADSFPAPLDAIYDIVKADETGNTSIIVVSQNDLNSAWIMANDNVGYGIPYHKSGNKMSTVRDTIVRENGREIKGYSDIIDHTRFQSETWKHTTSDHKANTSVKKPINIYDFWDFKNTRLSKNGLIRKNLMAYIDHCEDAGYNPKFVRYLQGGKVLTDTLKYAKEMGFVSQNATVDDISFKYKGYTIPYGYYKFLGDFGMFTPDGKVSPPKTLSLANYDFDKAVRFFDDAETLRRNEILQQFVNGTERDTLRNSDLTTEQLADLLRVRRDEVVSDVMKRHYGKSGDVSYSLPYETAIASLKDGTLDTEKNTHLKVLEHTPQIYIEKADAADREIVMGWDIAYLAMNKSGTIPGHYHGLGADVMKALPSALEDPLYIVKQNSGRIAAVTKIVVKGKRAVFASIELETFKTTIQDGEPESKVYNLVVTVTDAKPNYLQNTIFSGDIVYNKNSEDPAHFILRLKSLEKAVPTYDLAGSSKDSIPETSTKSNPSYEKSSEKSEKDSEYMDAVNRGDMETAQKMVERAARSAGYKIHAYHGTNAEFTVFDTGKQGQGVDQFGAGFYFANNSDVSERYGNRMIESYLKLEKPIRILRKGERGNLFDVHITKAQAYQVLKRHPLMYDPEESPLGDFYEEYWEVGAKEWMVKDLAGRFTSIGELDSTNMLFRDYPNELHEALRDICGFDGVQIYFETDAMVDERNDEYYVTWFPEQAKSADPVTYDDYGNVIPLSKRFDTRNPDIRYSLPSDLDPNAPLLDEKGKPIPYESFVDRGVPYARSPETNVGQMRKAIANATHYKVYSKKAMLDIVKQFPGADLLHAATRDKIADSMWQSFNSFKTTEEAESYIRDMARYILSVSMKEAKVQKPVSDDAQRRFEYMRAYVNGLTFTKSDLEDIKSAKGEDGYKRIIGRWGYKARKNGKEHKTPMDVFVTDIAREMPEFADFENMTPVDAFLALDEAYAEAKAIVNDKWQSIYEDATDADLDDMLGALEHELYTAFSEAGSVTAWRARFDDLLDRYKKKSDYWKAQYDNENRYQRLKKMIEDDARKLRDIKTHKFANATQVENDTLDASIGKLANVMYKGNLSVKKARQAASDLLVLYRSNAFRENVLEYYDQNQLGYYNEAIETYLEILSGSSDLLPAMEGHLGADEEFRENVTKQGEKGFTKNELKMLDKVMSYFINFYKNYGKVYHRGNLVEAKPLAERWVGIAQGNKDVKELLLLRSVAGQWYKDTFLDPMSLMRMADGYESGFYTEMMEQAREAMIAAQFEEMTVMRKYDEFLEKNKKYLRNSSKDTVTLRGHEIVKNKLIDLYCTTKRDQAWRGLAINGYNYIDTKGKTIRVDGELDAGKRYGISEIHAAVMRLQKEIEQHLTALDLEYIEIIEEIYNVDSKRLKQERDFARQGFTNVEEGYYYPIRRGHIATNIDKAPIKEELDRVSNASFNKEIVKNAAQELCIDSADARIRRHVRAVCQYAHLSPIIEEFNRMYNYDISGNRNHPISVATETKNTWSNARDYWQKMISDMQGVTARSEMEGALSYVRGGYAIAMLSMNPKVWVTQLSSFAAASSMLDASSIAGGGFVVSREDIENIGRYCPLADIRKYENTAALAQGVLDRRGVKVGVGGRAMSATRKFGEWGMKPIGAMDSFVINRLFGACMLQVEKNGVAKRGTEANKIAAGKLLTQLILETQQNSMATERSAAMRSNSELLRTVTMFSADAMKVISRCVDGFGEVRVIKYHLKNKEMTAEVREQYTARLKIAKRKLRKSLAALLVSAAYMAGITALFKTLYNKWDKERKEDESLAEAVAKSMTVDFAGNLVGGLPLIRDVYSKLVEGYDVDNYAYSAINDVLNAGKKMTSIFDADATRAEKASAIRSLVYSTSSFSGIPARNMYNAVFGITKRISEPTAYKIDEVFYKHNYKTDLEKYIDQGDTKMADFMLGLLYDTETTELADSTLKSLRELAELGYKVSPRAVSDSVTVDGEEYPISVAEQSAIETEYFSNLKALDRLTSSASYAKLTDEQRHYAVKSVLDVYYKKAVSDVMGTEASKSVLIASVIGAENMGVFAALVKDYEDDLDKKGEKISGTKRKKIIAAINAMPITTNQKILLMYAKGYTPKDGDIRGVSASSAKTRLLNTIVGANGLTKEQKESLAKACGLTVKNGKIIVK